MQPDPDSNDLTSASASYMRYAGLGIQFAGTVGVFAWLGWWADRKFGTSPWILLAAVMLGFFGSFYSLIRRVPVSSKRSRTPPRT